MNKIKTNPFLFCFITLALLAALLCGTAFCTNAEGSGERILSYDSSIHINSDSSLTVTENIKVRSEGINIKTGIYRDFPTKYTDKTGKQYKVGFEVLSVKRNGENQNYQIESLSNGKRVYMRDKGVLIPAGEYTFTLEYKTTRQIGFFEDHDELYWNVTGSGWSFPIDQASAKVFLPSEIAASEIKQDAFTGSKGSTKKNYSSEVVNGNEVFFETTSPLSAYEGLTIAVGWPKGFVTEPPPEKISYNHIIFLTFGLIITLIYFILSWVKVGKDPEKGTIIPLYYPPEGFSPAALRYISRMGFDTKIFASSIINMAVNKYLTIKEESRFGGKTFSILRNSGDESALYPEEALIANELLGQNEQFDFEQTHYSQISSAISKETLYLNKNYNNKYFKTNYGYFFVGLLISIIAYAAGILSVEEDTSSIIVFISVWLSLWSIGVTVLISILAKSWKLVMSGSKSRLPMTLFISIFSVPFIIGEIGALIMLAFLNFFICLAFTAFFIINALFWNLLKAPTLEGREVLDKIEGFKMYLSYAEKDELNYSTPLDITPEIFEKYLPFALALEVENQWSEKFASALEKAGQEQNYYPVWYNGNSWDINNISGFTSSIGDTFSSAISSSSTSPGSSSGFSGGSSGGGGGGGGGGGC
ncbi:MAG: DUF2207 domain-containing protein [Deltaproteobacteria bacterium]